MLDLTHSRSRATILAAIELNAPMGSDAIAEVIDSRSSDLPVGSLVIAMTNWVELAVLDSSQCRPMQANPATTRTACHAFRGRTRLARTDGVLCIA
jgi:NADPH-dependent curcumin reductase CurA